MRQTDTINRILSIIETYGQLTHTMAKKTRQYGTHHQLRQDQLMLIERIGSNPNCSLGYLVQAVGTGMPTVSLQIDRLIELGLVNKCRSPLNKRRIEINLTEDGSVVYNALQKNSSDFFSAVAQKLEEFSPEQLEGILKFLSGMLYDPATNLRAGAALISELYRRYGVWETVYAAYYAGEAQVDLWLADPEIVNAQGRLENIPDKATAKYVKQMQKAVELYEKLYYNV